MTRLKPWVNARREAVWEETNSDEEAARILRMGTSGFRNWRQKWGLPPKRPPTRPLKLQGRPRPRCPRCNRIMASYASQTANLCGPCAYGRDEPGRGRRAL